MKRIGALTMLALVTPLTAGCSPFGVAKRGFKEFRGAHGKVEPVREAD